MRPVFFMMTLLAISVCAIQAQEAFLPKGLTHQEQAQMAAYMREKHAEALRSVPTPPPGPVRTMAEWEEIQALVITWSGQQTILREITRHAVKECKVLIITNNPGSVSSTLTNAGIPLDSVEFVNTPFNSIWIRDYGPWTVYKNDVDSLWIVDWIYNRPRPADDATPVAIADHLNIPIYEATVAPYDWVHTGGNHLPDGMGKVFSSMLVFDENPDKTETQIDSIARIFLGVQDYIKFPTLPYDGIHHLDMHMRVIDEETILFGEYPQGISDGPQIESNIQYLLDEHTTAFGNPYRIERLQMPPDAGGRYPHQGGDYRTYTNSIFLNKTILVPTYEERYDTTALRIYRENLPGYNVVGINCNSIIPSLGALHCITKTVGVADPLWIAHAKLRDSEESSQEYPVVATIKHRSGIESAAVWYRTSEDSLYTLTSMSLIDTQAHRWAAIIPPHPAGTTIEYYIHATANNGKQQVRPIVAPEGYFRFRILGESANVPPTVRIMSPEDESTYAIDFAVLNVSIESADTDGSVKSVALYINDVLAGTMDTLPYVFEWVMPGEGVYSFVAVAEDDDGAVAVSDTVVVTIEGTTGLQTQDRFSFEAYPNPVTDRLYLQWDEVADLDIELTDLTGRILFGTTISGQQFQLDVSGWNAGVYYLTLRNGSRSSAMKVLKL